MIIFTAPTNHGIVTGFVWHSVVSGCAQIYLITPNEVTSVHSEQSRTNVKITNKLKQPVRIHNRCLCICDSQSASCSYHHHTS